MRSARENHTLAHFLMHWTVLGGTSLTRCLGEYSMAVVEAARAREAEAYAKRVSSIRTKIGDDATANANEWGSTSAEVRFQPTFPSLFELVFCCFVEADFRW